MIQYKVSYNIIRVQFPWCNTWSTPNWELLIKEINYSHRVFVFCACCCVHWERQTERERERETERERVMHLLVEGLGGKKRGSEGGGTFCPLQHIHSTMPVLNSPSRFSLTAFLFFFFSKCKSPWKMCWSNICTEVVLGQADNLSVFEFGFPCSK